MTARQCLSASSSSSAADIAWLTSPLMAFRASGRLIVRISTFWRRSRSTTAKVLSPLDVRALVDVRGLSGLVGAYPGLIRFDVRSLLAHRGGPPAPGHEG